MTWYARNIRPHVDRELRQAALQAQDPGRAFAHLERAHVLGQASTVLHCRVHWRMLCWGIEQRRPQEVVGQALRWLAALTKTVFGLVPEGNSGGANVSPFRPMPVPADLANLIRQARTGT